MKRLVVIVLFVLAGCGGEPQPSSVPVPPAAPTASKAQSPAPPAVPAPAAPAPDASSGQVQAHMVVVDLEGNPLAGMLPIATRQPNAFDPPVVHGEPTDAEGKGTVLLPPGESLCVRAWDPTLRFFTNNYFDVFPGSAESTELMKVVMVPGASLSVVVTDAGGAPVSNTEVALMMSHPSKGPWWPDQAATDARGVARFPAVPPGRFTVMLKTGDKGQIEVPEVSLPPGGSADLGTVTLQ